MPTAARATRRGRPGWLLLGVVAMAGCAGGGADGTTGARPTPARSGSTSLSLASTLDEAGRGWVEATLGSLTLEEKVAQLVFPWVPGGYASTSSPEFLELAALVEELGVGGLVVSIGTPHAYAAKLNELQRRARIPLLVTSDFESGGPGMRLAHSYAIPSLLHQGGGTSFPPTMALGAAGDPRLVREHARVTGVEARAVGVHLNFAPVLDVNSNPENPVINTRSFGEDPELVARLGAAYVRGAREGGVLTTAKHFPGHGDTRTDSHLELPAVPADRARLDSVELVPFRAALDAGVDAVMTAHVMLTGLEGPDAPPATLSPVLMRDLLREELGFEGLLFTDALRMGAISEGWGPGEAAVLALEAGADVILAPSDPALAVESVVIALRSGRLPERRIDASVRRILAAKARVGLHQGRLVDLEAVDERVGTGPHRAFADTVAARSITLVRDRETLVPLNLRSRRALHVAYHRPGDPVAGRAFGDALDSLGKETPEAAAGPGMRRGPERERRRRRAREEGRRRDAAGERPDRPAPEIATVRVSTDAPEGTWETLRALADSADVVVVSVHVPPVSGSGSLAVDPAFAAFVGRVQALRPTVVVSFGSPYVLSAFPAVGTYMLAWGDREVSQVAGARALLGLTPITGTLPISIPPEHRVGDGLYRPAVRAGALPARPGGGRRARRGAAAGPGSGTAGPDQAPPLSMVASPLELPPDSTGFPPAALAAVDSLILEALADSASPGASLAVGWRGGLLRLRGYGHLDWAPDAAPVTPSSLYDLASLTKVVGTTTAAMLLVDRGRLDLDAPVIRYLPWWEGDDPRKGEVTVRQLLLHRAGLPPFRRFFLEIEGREAYRRAIGALPLEYPPGERTVYSDIGIMTLGFVVEALAGRPLDELLEREVWSRLGMQDTGFRPPARERARVAPTEVDTLFRKEHLRGVVHDENAWAMGGVAGHAGLFSSARDLAVFAQMLLDRGIAGPCQPEPRLGVPCSRPRAHRLSLLDAGTVARFTARFDSTSSRALGWDTPAPGSSAGARLGEGAFGHTGFTGTSLWLDPRRELFVVLLTNRVNPSRDNDRHVALRRALHDLAAELVDGAAVGDGGRERSRDPGAPRR